MRAAKTRTLSRAVTAEQLYATALSVVEEQKYTLGNADAESLRLAFASGKTAISWGQEFLVEIAPSGEGAEMTVLCGSLDAAPKALMDGWKGGRAADAFVAAVEAALDAR
jgi:hypothetical protein